MRPIPTARHLAAIAILAAVSLLFGVLAMHEPRISDRQERLATVALKDHDRSLFANDPVYGDSGLWELNTPIFQGMMKFSLVPSGYEDVTLPFRLMTGVVAMIYLCGMYALLYQQCRSWSVAVYVAVASAAVLEAIPGLQWGFGALETTDPQTLCLATLPYVMLAYLRYERQWQVALVFASLGLMANLSLPTAVNLVVVLAGLHIARRRFRPTSLLHLGLGLAGALVAALPYVAYVIWLRGGHGGDGGGYDAAKSALAVFDRDLLYPRVLTKLLNWRLLIMLLALGVPSVLVLVRVERYRVRHQSVWLWLIVSAIVTGFGLQGISQAVAKIFDVPPMLAFFGALRLVVLPLFVLLSQALTNLFRLAPRQRVLFQWLGVAALVAWVGPAENLRMARYAAWHTTTRFLDEANKPRSVLRHQDRAARHAELMAAAEWTRRNAASDAVVVTGNALFRMASRRSITGSADDWPYYYYGAPGELEAWQELIRSQDQAFYEPAAEAGDERIISLVKRLATQPTYQGASEWYLLADNDAEVGTQVGLEAIEASRWGRFYRLYRIRTGAAP